MKYRLGLDMGTNSIGFSVIELSKENNPIELVDMGVRIFRDGRNPKDKQPLAVARREARGLRRQRDRRIQRKQQIMKALISNGLFPDTEEGRQSLKLMDPFVLRKEALDRELSDFELGRALFHLGSRRGFKSNRITDEYEAKETSEKSKLTQADKISNLTKEMNEVGARTIGEYLYLRICNGCGARFRGGDFNCYPSREHYVEEFNLIRMAQEKYHPGVDWDSIYQSVFFQRPLRKQERGKCRFYTDKERAYAALPSAQQFRILSEINNLKFADVDGNVLNLSNEEKDKLFSVLDNCKTMSFPKVRRVLGLPASCKFNLEDERRDNLKGNETSFAMRKPEFFGELWDSISLENQDYIVDYLLEAETDEEVLELLDQYGSLKMEQKDSILKVKFGRKVGSLSAEFMRDCLAIMRKEHIRYDEAVAKMDFHHSYNPITELQNSLPYYGKILTQTVMGAHPEAGEDNPEFKYGKIANPTVHIALNQLRKVVNSLIEHYGKPEQIVVELSRDISDSAEERSRKNSEQAKREKENIRIKEQIKELNIPNPTAWDVKKYKLWEELGKDSNVRRCPYCGKPIPASKLFTKEIEIEHILPYSRTMLDSMSNLTVAHSSCNLAKSNLTPYEAFSSSPDGFEWQEIMARVQNLPANKRSLFSKDAIRKFDEGEGFLVRQLNDNRYLSKAARDYLSCICPANQIWGIPGFNTAFLRARWGLNRLLNKNGDPYVKNRTDHRHHSLDAVVIGLTDRGIIKEMAELNRTYNSVDRMNVPEFPFDLERVKTLLRKMVISYKPEHGYQGRIYKETAVGLKYVKNRIKIQELTEKQVRENLLVSKSLNDKLLEDMGKGKSFRALKNALIEKAKEAQKAENPVIDVFEKIWITRVPLVDLTDKDINSKRVFSRKIAQYLIDNTQDVISDKKALKTRLQELSEKAGIKRVRYIPNNQEFARINSVQNKWYEKDGVCFASIWEILQKGKQSIYQGQFISYQEAYNHETGKLKEYPKPHPAARKILTLYKDDVIRLYPNDGSNPYYAVCSGFSTTQNKVDLQPVQSAESIEKWIERTSPDVIDDYERWFNRPAGHNFFSINSLFHNNRIAVVKVSPDGRIEHQ